MENKFDEKLLNPQFHKTALIMRLAWLAVVVPLYLFQVMDGTKLQIFLVGIALSFVYQLLFFKPLEQRFKYTAAYLSLITYLIPLFCLVHLTGGLLSPFYDVLFFAIIGTALSFGSNVGLVIGVSMLAFVLLTAIFPDNSSVNYPASIAIKAVLLALFIPFASIAAKRYVDVNKAKQDAERLAGALNESLRKERDMLDILGHELRTPLSIVRNAVQMIIRFRKLGKLTDEKLTEYLDNANEHSDRLSKQLETILFSTKIDNQKLTLNFEKVDVIDVIKDSLTGLKSKAEKKGLEVILELPKEAFAYADRARAQQILDNLLDNAVKYTDEGSVKITLTEAESMLALSVLDTGKGIPEEDIPKLGHKFFRVDNYISTNGGIEVVRPGGTGIGLYVTFQLVKAMGGRVAVSSKLGSGSTFTIYLPKYTGQAVVEGKTSTELIEEKFAHTAQLPANQASAKE